MKTKNPLILIRICLLLFISGNAGAQIKDNTFDFDGHVATPMGIGNAYVRTVLVQPDLKIIAAGYQEDASVGDSRFAIARYLTDGSLDPGFGVSGKVISAFGSQNWCNVVALQPDGKILAAGQTSTSMCIGRYHSNGTIDSTFGTNGHTTLGFTGSAGIYRLVILSDGSIITGGTSQIPFSSNFEIKLVKFTANGLVDTSFGTMGIVTPNFGFVNTTVAKILVQNDGKILIGGGCTITQSSTQVKRCYLARFMPNGDADSSFTVNGKDIYTTALAINDMVFDANYKIVAVGNIGTNAQGTSGDVVVMRFDDNGVLDPAFGQSGATGVSVDSYAEYANAVALQPDGKILLGGSYWSSSTLTDCLLVRFLANGTVDNTFGVNGIFKMPGSSGTDAITSMAMSPDNKIVTGGYGLYANHFYFIVDRINSDIVTGTLNFNLQSNNILISPNPGSDMVTVRASDDITSMQLLDINGRILLVNEIKSNQSTLDISKLSNGIYYLKVFTDKGMVVNIVKQ